MRLQTRRTRAEVSKAQRTVRNWICAKEERRVRLLEELERNMEGFQQSVKQW